MKAVRYLSLFAGAGILVGCQGLDVERLNDTSASGDAFTQQLTAEYRDLANFEAEQLDWRDADHFARKGLAAAGGEAIGPDDVGSRMLPTDTASEASEARGDLVTALNGGARSDFPIEAAVAQAKFDCWLEQAEEGSHPDHTAACRDEFYAALAAISTPVIEPAAVYFVFFDFDSSVVTSAGQAIIDNVIADYEGGIVNVVGFTDTSGSPAYNQALSERRATSVAGSLVAGGISDANIVTSGLGETNLLVETLDGVREPSNRRAEITFQ